MKKERLQIKNIPAVIWGEASEKVVIAVHGNMSNKEDIPIELLSKHVLPAGFQVLSFDLPEHGDRKNESTLCKVQNCVEELKLIMGYARERWGQISLFANSIGAYFSLMAYGEEPIQRAWFLSPIVDMRRLIENMMTWFSVTEAQLKDRQTIATPMGQNLYWDYYSYVKEHPVSRWKIPTCILYGGKDNLCEREVILHFAKEFTCKLEISEASEHFFHTEEQLEVLNRWLDETAEC